jgi:hypothetical protein
MATVQQPTEVRSIPIEANTDGRRSPIRGTDRRLAETALANICGYDNTSDIESVEIGRYGTMLTVKVKGDSIVCDTERIESKLSDKTVHMLAHSTGNVTVEIKDN